MIENVTPMGTSKMKELKYVLLAGDRADNAFYHLHDSAYRLWRTSWLRTLEELKSDHQLRADDFVRQELVTGLYWGDEAVGLLLHTYLDLGLEAVRDHSYLATYPAAVLDRLREEGASRVLSMEYLTLDRRWRKARVGVPLAEIMLGLGAKVSVASGLASMLVVTRNDRHVNEILYSYGARCLVKDQSKHNVSVDLVSLDHGKVHFNGNEETRRWIEHFWDRRVDTTGLLEEIAATIRRAA